MRDQDGITKSDRIRWLMAHASLWVELPVEAGRREEYEQELERVFGQMILAGLYAEGSKPKGLWGLMRAARAELGRRRFWE